MKKASRTIAKDILCLSLPAIVLSACGNTATPEPTLDLNAFATAVVETMEADETETSADTSTALPESGSSLVILPTETPASVMILPTTSSEGNEMLVNRYNSAGVTNTPTTAANMALPEIPTVAAAPVFSAIPATATITPKGDKASYDTQTPLDGSHVERGSEFDITWYLLNTGTTTWTTDYCLRYFTGTNFTKPGKNRYYLNKPVPPNTVGACIVDALAPEEPGTYKMSVVLGNENDENFFIVDLTIVVD